jgi:acetyltransferase EpsM
MATPDPAAQGADPGRSLSATATTAGSRPGLRALVVVGGGQHAAVVVEAARSRPDRWRVVGFSERDRASRLARREPELEDLGDDDALRARLTDASSGGREVPVVVLGVGGGTRPGGRASIVERFDRQTEWATVVHAAASVSPSATVGAGVVIGAGAIVQAGASIGGHAIVNSGAIVEHDVVLGAHVHLAPGAVVGGGTTIGDGAFVGLGARIRDHVTVGAGATVGMGAVVVDDVAPDEVVLGVPARRAGSSA